jgi:DNA-binding transcriptional LysR family regulator
MARRGAPTRSDLDLNLLAILDALLVERSVTRAADRVGLSQSAASHALARLRDHFGDPLLVRGRSGMVLTARANELAAPIRQALEALDTALRGARAFDARRARRRFTIAMTDYLAVVVLPPLYERLAREAPGIDLVIASVVRSVEDTLETESVDLVVTMAAIGDDRPALYQQRLFEERYVCVMRRGHRATHRPLTVDAYCALDHALIAPRGGPGIVDRQLAARGLTRRVAVQVPHSLVAPHLVAGSDLVLTVVERLARTYAAMLPLDIVELPIDVPATTCWQRWHERSHGDAAHAWLRGLVAEVASALA